MPLAIGRSSGLVLVFIWLLAQGVEPFKITGATGGIDSVSKSLPSRYEINDFATSGPAFDLYILALQNLQDQDQSELLSYFQIAGIHGYPVIPWDGVIGKGTGSGYCMHNSVLFPTWHRPYLALFEQLISARAQIIARTYPTLQRDRYQDAARKLRVPYWDWAFQPGLPPAVTSPVISINTPYGYSKVQNPLYMYIFHPGKEGNGIPRGHPLSDMPNTVRHYDAVTGRSNDSAATAVLVANAPSILSLTYQFLTSADDYTSISCVWTGGDYNPPFNLENIHNNIHNYVGGSSGHMTWPELSAFDPVFWLHHANVDRLLAIWQAMHPQSYVTPATNLYGSYYEVRGTVDSGNTSLAPFHSDNGTVMFTSDGVRNVAMLGYTYPELINHHLNTVDFTSDVTRKVNQLYAPSAVTRISQPKLQRRSSNVEHAFSHITLETVRGLEVNNREVQWSIEVTMDRNNYNGRSSIDFFMGALPLMSQSSTAPNLVGSYGQFVPANSSESDVSTGTSHGGLSLTHTLVVGMARGFLENLSAESVIPVLRDHLRWRARSDDDCEIELGNLAGLAVSVQSRQVKPRKSLEEVPIYGEYETHPEVTAGKTGGIGYLQQAYEQPKDANGHVFTK